MPSVYNYFTLSLLDKQNKVVSITLKFFSPFCSQQLSKSKGVIYITYLWKNSSLKHVSHFLYGI